MSYYRQSWKSCIFRQASMSGQIEHRMGSLRRMRRLSDAAIRFCLGTKALFGLDLRQTIETAASLIELAGPNWPAPDYSTPCCGQKTATIRIPAWRFGGPPRSSGRQHGRKDGWR
ncbi:MAG TPA: transposase [Paracoccus sp. (in: a-proteobacteria)]|nr:transposase [Paracoccus sp. (in: a-proteobacteria)]